MYKLLVFMFYTNHKKHAVATTFITSEFDILMTVVKFIIRVIISAPLQHNGSGSVCALELNKRMNASACFSPKGIFCVFQGNY